MRGAEPLGINLSHPSIPFLELGKVPSEPVGGIFTLQFETAGFVGNR